MRSPVGRPGDGLKAVHRLAAKFEILRQSMVRSAVSVRESGRA